MDRIDFTTALGRLLRDGVLRDAFAASAAVVVADLGVSESDRQTLAALKVEDLEFQARVLLRKRFESVRRLIPATCASLGEQAWPCFHAYARTFWPDGPRAEIVDAASFCKQLSRTDPNAVCRSEVNRLEFARSKRRLAVAWVSNLFIEGRSRRGLQILLRHSGGVCREFCLYLAF